MSQLFNSLEDFDGCLFIGESDTIRLFHSDSRLFSDWISKYRPSNFAISSPTSTLCHFATLPATRSRYPLHKTSSLRWRLFSTIFSPPETHIWFSSRKAAETKYLWSVSTNDNQEQQKPRIRILKTLIFITVKYVEVRVCILHWVYVSQLDKRWYEYQV